MKSLIKDLAKEYWVYFPLAIAIPVAYTGIRPLLITQEPSVLLTQSNITVNMVALFALCCGLCPTIAKKLHWPRWAGFAIQPVVWAVLIGWYCLWGLSFRW